MKRIPSPLDDSMKAEIKRSVRKYRAGVLRGDFSRDWAAVEVAGEIAYPYSAAGYWDAVRQFALECLS